MMISYFYHFTNLFNLLIKTEAIAIFTASGAKNGITHQPSIVIMDAGSLLFAYTTANHAVPNA